MKINYLKITGWIFLVVGLAILPFETTMTIQNDVFILISIGIAVLILNYLLRGISNRTKNILVLILLLIFVGFISYILYIISSINFNFD